MEAIKEKLHFLKYSLLRVLIFITKFVNVILKPLIGFSTHSGFVKDRKEADWSYEKCVHVQRILFRAQPSQLSKIPQGCFLLSHENYAHPDILRQVTLSKKTRACLGKQPFFFQDNVALYYLHQDRAYFIEFPGDVDIYNTDINPFFYQLQYTAAAKILSMSLEHFVQFGESLGDPKAKVVYISSTGRCGSTLLTQMFEKAAENTLVISEPWFSPNLTAPIRHDMPEKYSKDPRSLIKASIRIHCKPFQSRTVDLFLFKTASMAETLCPMISRECPYVKHIFMYRAPEPYVRSISTMAQVIAEPVLRSWMAHFEDEFFDGCTPEGMSNARDVRRMNREALQDFGSYRMWMSNWCLHVLHYREYLRKGSVDFAPVSYEELVGNPVETMTRLLEHCSTSTERVENCLRAMENDSQRGTLISQDKLRSKRAKMEFTEDERTVLSNVMLGYGFPPLEQYQDIFN